MQVLFVLIVNYCYIRCLTPVFKNVLWLGAAIRLGRVRHKITPDMFMPKMLIVFSSRYFVLDLAGSGRGFGLGHISEYRG